jgi:hypothetical protein
MALIGLVGAMEFLTPTRVGSRWTSPALCHFSSFRGSVVGVRHWFQWLQLNLLCHRAIPLQV